MIHHNGYTAEEYRRRITINIPYSAEEPLTDDELSSVLLFVEQLKNKNVNDKIGYR